jgi:hypothetical protein
MEHWQTLRCGGIGDGEKEAGMLPRVATTTGTLQPSPALQAGASVDAAAKPQLSAAALANLRAEVLLRLIETMLKHMPRTAEPSPNRDLLETLLVALKTLPGRDGESGRKLAEIIAKLPPELRPSVEKLISTVLSSVPTRSLVEILRNPNGPEAQKLATLLATGLNLAEDGELHTASGERQPKPVALNAQQLAAVGRHGAQQAAQTMQVPSDARALQMTLKRIFDFDGNGKARSATAQATGTDVGRVVVAGAGRLPAEPVTATLVEPRLPTPLAKAGDQQPVEASAAVTRNDGSADEIETATPAVKREELPAKAQVTNAAGQALARSVLQAVARDIPAALLTQAVAHLVESLSPEEANFLRALLERPIDPAVEQELASLAADRPEDDAAQATEAKTGKVQAEASQSLLLRQTAEQDEPLPMPLPRETAQTAAANATPEKLPQATVLREGVPLAFVPYLPAEEDLEWPENRKADKDEADDEQQAASENDGEAEEDADFDSAEDEPETADMARKREKTAEMVGVIEPGLVFYQKLGDYWT